MTPDARVGEDAVLLSRGESVTVHFDGRDVTVWWGPDSQDRDRVAVRSGRVLTWPTADAAVDEARRRSRIGLGIDDDGSIQRLALDFEPAHAWLRGQRSTLDPNSALDLWNFAADVAASLGLPWRDRGRTADRCYRKLVAANVPYVFDLASFRPRWLADELRCIRRVLSSAVHVLRTALG
jgi:hypothetical protein